MERNILMELWTPPGEDDKPRLAPTWIGNVALAGFLDRRHFGRYMTRKELALGLPIEGATAWIGDVGSGKSMGMTRAAQVLRDQGFKVYSNGMGWNFEDGSFNTFDEMAEIVAAQRDGTSGQRRPIVLAVDEAPFWVNARKWSEFPDSLFLTLQQVRKFGIAFYYTTIRYEQVDINLRRLTKWAWTCKRGVFGTFISELTPGYEELLPLERPVKRIRFRPRIGEVTCYDTLQVLGGVTSDGS